MRKFKWIEWNIAKIDAHGLSVMEVEAALQVPVVSSSPAGFWDLVRCAGLDPRSPGHGRLFA